MRRRLKVSFPIESGNSAVRAGELGSTIQSILEDLKPRGQPTSSKRISERAGFVFFDMKDFSELHAVGESWFLAFNAKLAVGSVMTPQ